MEEEEEEGFESLCFLCFLHLYSVGFGSNYNWDQLLMFGHVDVCVPQEPSRVISGQFLHNIQLFWQLLYGHVYTSTKLLKFCGSILIATRYIN